MKNTWKHSLQIAFTYIGTVVGAGFASGREILEFFVQYGTQGLVGIFLACLLFIWAGVRIMIIARRMQSDSCQDVSTYLFGRTVGVGYNLILLVIMLGTTSVMLSATGSIFADTFRLPSQFGIWFSMICVFGVAIRGLTAIHAVNSLFVPTLIGFTLLVFVYTQPWAASDGVIVEQVKPWVWFSSPLYYVALNIALTQSVLIPIGRESASERPLIIGGLLGGLGIGVLLLFAYSSIRIHMPQIEQIDMPMIHILSGLGRWVTVPFALLVYAEIFSSLVANVFGLVQQMRQLVALPQAAAVCLILGISYAVSFVGFAPLLSLLYPLFGQIVVLFLLMLGFRQLFGR